MQHPDGLFFAMGYTKSIQLIKELFCKQQKTRRQTEQAGTWALA